MEAVTILIATMAIFVSCTGKKDSNTAKSFPVSVKGTWQLTTATTIEKGDTVATNYNKNVSFIKIINDTHFAFLQHDVNKGKDTAAVFVSGGGRYSLINDSLYTEHLEYCSDRNWEGNDFKFTIKLKDDTLIQSGVEKLESEGINRINIEKYVRIKK